MANTYSQIFIQIVFAVKGRQSLIREAFREQLEKYISGIITNRNKNYMPFIVCPIIHIFW